jgi:hypothetical protein
VGAWTILDSPYFDTYVELALLANNRRDLKRILREFDNWQKGRPLDYEPKSRTIFRYRARLPKRKRDRRPKIQGPYKPLVDFDKLFRPPAHLVGVWVQPPSCAKAVFGEVWGYEEIDRNEPIYVLPHDEQPAELTHRRKGVIKKTHRSSLYDREHPWWTTWKPSHRRKKITRRRKLPKKTIGQDRPDKVSNSELEAALSAFYASKAAERKESVSSASFLHRVGI